jgi:hypothetical protein
MKDFSQYKEIAKTANTVMYTLETDLDIIIIVPLEGTMDNAKDARENAAFVGEYAHRLGRPVGSVVIMANMLAQEPEARRAYAEIDPKDAYGAALVVENALSRALGSFFIGLTRPAVHTQLVDSVEKGLEWLRTMRPK